MVRQYELRKRKENYCLIKKHNTLLWSNNENRPKRTRSILGFMFLYILSPSLIWRNLASVELCLAGIQSNDKSIGDECVHSSGSLLACEQALLFRRVKRVSAPRSHVLARLASLAQIGELARRLALYLIKAVK